MATLQLEIVTPEGKVFSGPVRGVTLPASEGTIGVLPGHAALMTQILPGNLHYFDQAGLHFFAVGEGFVEITAQKVSLLTDLAVEEDQIDEAEVEKALANAKKALLEKGLVGEEAEAVEASIVRSAAMLHLKRRTRS